MRYDLVITAEGFKYVRLANGLDRRVLETKDGHEVISLPLIPDGHCFPLQSAISAVTEGFGDMIYRSPANQPGSEKVLYFLDREYGKRQKEESRRMLEGAKVRYALAFQDPDKYPFPSKPAHAELSYITLDYQAIPIGVTDKDVASFITYEKALQFRHDLLTTVDRMQSQQVTLENPFLLKLLTHPYHALAHAFRVVTTTNLPFPREILYHEGLGLRYPEPLPRPSFGAVQPEVPAPLLFIFDQGFKSISIPPNKEGRTVGKTIRLTSCDDGCLITTDTLHEDLMWLQEHRGSFITEVLLDTNEVRPFCEILVDVTLTTDNYQSPCIYLHTEQVLDLPSTEKGLS